MKRRETDYSKGDDNRTVISRYEKGFDEISFKERRPFGKWRKVYK